MGSIPAHHSPLLLSPTHTFSSFTSGGRSNCDFSEANLKPAGHEKTLYFVFLTSINNHFLFADILVANQHFDAFQCFPPPPSTAFET